MRGERHPPERACCTERDLTDRRGVFRKVFLHLRVPYYWLHDAETRCCRGLTGSVSAWLKASRSTLVFALAPGAIGPPPKVQPAS